MTEWDAGLFLALVPGKFTKGSKSSLNLSEDNHSIPGRSMEDLGKSLKDLWEIPGISHRIVANLP